MFTSPPAELLRLCSVRFMCRRSDALIVAIVISTLRER
jgi:hypothetical protein